MKLSIRLNQQAVIIWYLTSKIRANRVAHSVLYIIPHFQKTWPRFFIIPSKQKFITKALRGGRLLMLSSKTTRSPAVFERSLKRNSREKEDTIEEGEKKAKNRRIPGTIKLDYALLRKIRLVLHFHVKRDDEIITVSPGVDRVMILVPRVMATLRHSTADTTVYGIGAEK